VVSGYEFIVPSSRRLSSSPISTIPLGLPLALSTNDAPCPKGFPQTIDPPNDPPFPAIRLLPARRRDIQNCGRPADASPSRERPSSAALLLLSCTPGLAHPPKRHELLPPSPRPEPIESA